MQLHRLSDSEVHSGLKNRSQAEREILSEIVRFICEVDRRRLFEKFGYPSLFEYLVTEMKYSNGSAQRRIDAARLLKDVPEIIGDLESGTINLTHTSAVAHGFKQKKRELRKAASTSTVEVKVSAPVRKAEADNKAALVEEKRELLEKVKGQTLPKTQELVAQSLNLEVKSFEKKTRQKDGSVRLEITLSREEAALLQKAKDILSHSAPGATATEILVKALSDFVQRKSPATKGTLRQKSSKHAATSTMEVKARTPNLTTSSSTSTASAQTTSTVEVKARMPLTAAIKREIFRKQSCCQWRDSQTGRICGSTFMLQADHRKPVWAGGTSESENLQLLCAAHNKMKYKLESGQLRIF